jgi:hypothetical protein
MAAFGRWSTRTFWLVIALYNLPVRRLERRPERVGTVDKFQGQEAPELFARRAHRAVTCCLAASSFYSAVTLNVVVSRAETLAIELYIAQGSRSVWVACRKPGVVRVFDPAGRSRKFEQGQTL